MIDVTGWSQDQINAFMDDVCGAAPARTHWRAPIAARRSARPPTQVNSGLASLATAAQQASAAVGQRVSALVQESLARDRQLFQSPRRPTAWPSALATIARRVSAPPELIASATDFDERFVQMINGSGWGARPYGGGLDNIRALQELVGPQLQAHAARIAATATQLARRAAQTGRKAVLGSILETYGADRAYELFGEAMWDELEE